MSANWNILSMKSLFLIFRHLGPLKIHDIAMASYCWEVHTVVSLRNCSVPCYTFSIDRRRGSQSRRESPQAGIFIHQRWWWKRNMGTQIWNGTRQGKSIYEQIGKAHGQRKWCVRRRLEKLWTRGLLSHAILNYNRRQSIELSSTCGCFLHCIIDVDISINHRD